MRNKSLFRFGIWLFVIFGFGLWANLSWGSVNSTPPIEQIKIYLDEDGIYRISGFDLIDAGVNITPISPQTLRLMSHGKEVPIYLQTQVESRFGLSDYLEFYGEKNRNADGNQNEYSDTNIYYLSWGKGTGLRWTIENNASINSGNNRYQTPAYFQTKLMRKDTNIYSRSAGESGNMQDLWFWREISAPTLNDGYVFTISNLARDTALSCSFNVELKGVSHVGSSPDHIAIIGVNGNKIGEARWDGQSRYNFICDTVPMTYLNDGKNVLEISLPGKTGDTTGRAPSIDVVYMVQFRVAYWKTFTATNNELEFIAPNNQDSSKSLVSDISNSEIQYVLQGFTDPEIKVYNIKQQKIIYPQIISQDSVKKYSVAFTARNENYTANYIAIPDSRKKEPNRLEKVYFDDLSRNTTGAEYLVIAHDEFYNAIQPLVEWRKKTGLTAKSVKISEVYDSFNFGIIDPKAIRSFIEYTYKNWKPVPKYVLLVGDVSIDLRGNLNQANARLFIPTYYWATYMGAAASDNWYVSVNSTDDAKPVMAIGRISAHSVTEVYNVVNKILQYEQRPVYGNWRQQMLFLASPESMFEGISEELAKQFVPPTYEVYRRYPSSGSPDYKYRTEDIVGNINDGRLILHFTGHGGGYVWESGRMDLEQHGVEVVPDNRDFFGFKNIQQLHNFGKYPFTIALTCYTGVFDNLDSDSLGEALLKSSYSGSIAVVSATWRSYVSSNDAFDRALFSQLFKKNVHRVGDIFLAAKQEINIPETSATYVLLGDPATTLSVPKETMRLTMVRKPASKTSIEIQGTFDKKRHGKGTVVIKTEKGKVVAEKSVNIFYSQRFATKLPIPTEVKDSTLAAYCYFWNEKAGWDAVGYSSITAVGIDTTINEKSIALPNLISSILWSATPIKNKNTELHSTDTTGNNVTDNDVKASLALDEGNRYYKQKDLFNALLQYSALFDLGGRDPLLIKRLKEITAPIETFEQATITQINQYFGNGKIKLVAHELSAIKSHAGKKSELIDLDYLQPGWFDYWTKEVNIPLKNPIGIRAYVCSTAIDTKLSLIALVAIGKEHWVIVSSQVQSIGSNWTELKIDDLYKIARKRALASPEIEEFKVYPDLYVATRNLDANPIWDIDNMRIIKVGVDTGGKSVQFWIDDIELFFPREKLTYYR